MNKIVILVIVVAMLITPSMAQAKDLAIKLPDGQTLPVKNLSPDEFTKLVKLVDKATADKPAELQTKAKEIVEEVKSPKQLNAWREAITGTIKDVCHDLNVTVNEFIKTPVGMGVAGLIIYKMVGKDLITGVMQAVILIPMWIVIMLIIFYLRNKYFGSTVIYKTKTEVGKDKKGRPLYEYTDPKQVLRYPWNSDEARVAFGTMLFVVGVLVTLIIAIAVV